MRECSLRIGHRRFLDKLYSLHSYGLAVDVHDIGRPGSPEAQLWHEIAARNGVICPYGPHDQTEWNHCQPTTLKLILAENPLRETIGAARPSDADVQAQFSECRVDALKHTTPRPMRRSRGFQA